MFYKHFFSVKDKLIKLSPFKIMTFQNMADTKFQRFLNFAAANIKRNIRNIDIFRNKLGN